MHALVPNRCCPLFDRASESCRDADDPTARHSDLQTVVYSTSTYYCTYCTFYSVPTVPTVPTLRRGNRNMLWQEWFDLQKRQKERLRRKKLCLPLLYQSSQEYNNIIVPQNMSYRMSLAKNGNQESSSSAKVRERETETGRAKPRPRPKTNAASLCPSVLW